MPTEEELAAAEQERKEKEAAEAEKKAKEGKDNPAPSLTEEQRLQALIDAQLKPIKSKLDEAYAQRDEAAKRIKEYEKRDREAELKRLEEEGKLREAYEGRLKDSDAAKAAAEKRVVELTRDLDVKNALSGFQFRNEKAQTVAFKELADQLVQNEHGDWVHKSGISIADAAKKFADDEANAFLFRAKVSTGGGTDTTTKKPDVNGEKSVFKMSQAEVMKRAAEGTLPKRQRR